MIIEVEEQRVDNTVQPECGHIFFDVASTKPRNFSVSCAAVFLHAYHTIWDATENDSCREGGPFATEKALVLSKYFGTQHWLPGIP